MVTQEIREIRTNSEVFDYGFGESETDILEIIGKMKDPRSSTVLVAHADVCRGFEWPTVIRVNLWVKDDLISTDFEINNFGFYRVKKAVFRFETITSESNMEMRAMVKLIPITVDTSDNGNAGVNFFSSILKIWILK